MKVFTQIYLCEYIVYQGHLLKNKNYEYHIFQSISCFFVFLHSLISGVTCMCDLYMIFFLINSNTGKGSCVSEFATDSKAEEEASLSLTPGKAGGSPSHNH